MRKFALLVWVAVFGWSSEAFGISYSDAVIADNPIGYWRLNETGGTVAQDATGNYDGTYVSAPDLGESGALHPTTGAPIEAGNTSVGLTGTRTAAPGQFIDLSADQGLSLYATDFTIEAWVNMTGIDPVPVCCNGYPERWDTIFYQQKGFSTGHNYENLSFNIAYDVNDAQTEKLDLHFWFYGDGGDSYIPNVVPRNEWTHVAVTYVEQSKVGTYFVNGEDVGQYTYSHGPSNMTSIVGSQIGAMGINGYGHPYDDNGQSWYRNGRLIDFDGGLDEVAVYKTALTSSQIQTHYLAAIPEPSTALLLGIGLAGLGMRRRQRTHRRG